MMEYLLAYAIIAVTAIWLVSLVVVLRGTMRNALRHWLRELLDEESARSRH